MTIESIAYTHGDAELTGLLGLPETREPRPGIVVYHGADGLSDAIRTRIEMLNALGYVALAADLYGGQHPLSGDAIGAAMMGLRKDPNHLRARIRAAHDLLISLPQVRAGQTAAIGYCFGGMAVLELARDGAPVLGGVSFHGLLTTPLPAKPGAVTARLLVCTGAQDPYAPKEDVMAFQDEMTAAQADWQVITYGGAEHAFAILGLMPAVDMPGIRYDAVADRRSWTATLSFFDELFGKIQ